MMEAPALMDGRSEASSAMHSDRLLGISLTFTNVAFKDSTKVFAVPMKIWDTIVRLVDLETIKNLRLASKVLARGCLGPYFIEFFKRDYTTDLSKRSLLLLEHLAAHPQIGPRVRSVTITCVVYDKSVSRRQSRTAADIEQVSSVLDCDWIRTKLWEDSSNVSEEFAIEILTPAFKYFGHLQRLILDGVLVRGAGIIDILVNGIWDDIRFEARQTYRRSMSAIFRSGLSVDTLVIYRNTPCCFVALHDLKVHTSHLMAESGRPASEKPSIKNLVLSVSARVPIDSQACERLTRSSTTKCDSSCKLGQRAQRINDPADLNPDDYDDVANLLSLMPALRHLDFHLYPVSARGDVLAESNGFVHERIFGAIAATPAMLPQLRACFFRGIYTKKGAMVKFLTEHRNLAHLRLERVVLTSRCSWAPIFRLLSRNLGDNGFRYMHSLRQVDLSYLWNSRLILVNLSYHWEKHDQNSNSMLARENRFGLTSQN